MLGLSLSRKWEHLEMTDWAIPEKQSDGESKCDEDCGCGRGVVVEKGVLVRRIGKREEREATCLWRWW